MEDSNPNKDLINLIHETLFICPQDIEQKQIMLPIKGHSFVTNL